MSWCLLFCVSTSVGRDVNLFPVNKYYCKIWNQSTHLLQNLKLTTTGYTLETLNFFFTFFNKYFVKVNDYPFFH